MKKVSRSKCRAEFYTIGELEQKGYEVMVESHMNTKEVDFYIRRKGYGDYHFCFGWYLEQPDAKDGHTEWTKEEAIELFEQNLDDEIEMYEEALRIENEAYERKFCDGRC